LEPLRPHRWLSRLHPSLLLWGGAALALSLLAAMAVALVFLWRDGRTEAEGDVRRFVRLLAQHAARTVDPVDRALMDVQRTLDKEGFGRTPIEAQRLHQLLHSRADPARQLQRMAIVDAAGRIVAVSDQPTLQPDLHVDEPWFAQLAAAPARGLTVHPQRTSRFSSARVVPMVRALVEPTTGAFLGMVVGAVDAAELQEFHRSLRLGTGWQLELLRDDGLALASGPPVHDWPALIGLLPAGVEEFVGWHGRGRDELVVGLHRVGQWPLVAAVSVHADATASPWLQRALALASIAGSGALALMGLAWFGAQSAQRSRRLSRTLDIAQARYRSLVESSPDGILLARDGCIEYANQALLRLAGTSEPAALAGRRVDELLDGVGAYEHNTTFDGPPRAQAVRLEHHLRPLAGAPREVETLITGAPPEAGDAALQIVVRDISARKAAERALRDSELRHRRDVEQMAMAAESAREREKRRIARELHDELGQVLTVQQLELEMLADELAGRLPALKPRLEALHARIDEAIAVTRRISGDLRPLVLDDFGLVAALEWLIGQLGARAGVQGELKLQGDPALLSDEVATTLFRIAQESVTNVMRHAAARHVRIGLAVAPDAAHLTVIDDGRGIDRRARRRGLGLRGIEERVRLLGGRVEIAEAAGGGTRVEVQLPLGVSHREAPDSGPQELPR
jgi:PAS domain S-box-containing protein